MSEADFRELAQAMTLKELNAEETIFDVDQEVGSCYMILSGSVRVTAKNQHIEDWSWARNVFERLQQWKTTIFDKKVEKQMQIAMFKAKMSADAK